MKSGNTPEKRSKCIEVLFIHILLLTAVRDQKQSSFLKLSLRTAPRTVTVTLNILTEQMQLQKFIAHFTMNSFMDCFEEHCFWTQAFQILRLPPPPFFCLPHSSPHLPLRTRHQFSFHLHSRTGAAPLSSFGRSYWSQDSVFSHVIKENPQAKRNNCSPDKFIHQHSTVFKGCH